MGLFTTKKINKCKSDAVRQMFISLSFPESGCDKDQRNSWPPAQRYLIIIFIIGTSNVAVTYVVLNQKGYDDETEDKG